MPLEPKRHCHISGHSAYYGRRCPKCQQDYDLRRGNSGFRGYDRRWRSFALNFLKKNPICSENGCEDLATDVDHIIALVDGGEKFDEKNLRGLCHRHHSARTGRDQVKHFNSSVKNV